MFVSTDEKYHTPHYGCLRSLRSKKNHQLDKHQTMTTFTKSEYFVKKEHYQHTENEFVPFCTKYLEDISKESTNVTSQKGNGSLVHFYVGRTFLCQKLT